MDIAAPNSELRSSIKTSLNIEEYPDEWDLIVHCWPEYFRRYMIAYIISSVTKVVGTVGDKKYIRDKVC